MPESQSKLKLSVIQGREWLLIAGPAALLVVLSLLVALRFVTPAPPRIVAISTGGETGGYYAFGKDYARVLARSGVTLDVRTSAGSVENIARLRDPRSGVSVALVQGGIADRNAVDELVSIGRVFHEPLWVFTRGAGIERLADLKGKRIGVAPEGSGTRVLATALLAANGVTEKTATLLPLTGQPAVDALSKGEADAIFLALAPQAPIIQQLIRSKDARLMSFAQGEAYTKVFPYLSRLTLPQGVFDLVANLPDRDITLVAPDAALVVRRDLHPAIVGLLAEAVQEVHGKASLFARAGQFPTQHDPEFEMDQDALRFYKSGPTFWKRILPFHWANLVERIVVMLVPLIGIALPLARAVPWLYRWRIRQRVLYWYKQLKDLEERVAELPQGASTAALVGELDEVDQSIRVVPAPIGFADQFYNLRAHVELVRQKLAARGTAAPA